jgi:hypothetical protein
MTGKRLDSVAHSLVYRVASRNAAGHIGKVDAIDAIWIFANKSDVAHFLILLC